MNDVKDDITGWAGEYELHHEDNDGDPVPPSEPGNWAGYFTGDWDGASSEDLADAKRTIEGRITAMAERLGVTDLAFDWVRHSRILQVLSTPFTIEVWYTVDVTVTTDEVTS